MSALIGLYDPYIHFRDDNWLKLTALYWDKMARIDLEKKYAATMCLIDLKSGTEASRVAMLNIGRTPGSDFPAALQNTAGINQSGLEKQSKTLAVDQVRVGRSSYIPKIVDINTYSEDVGNVVITYFDIEKRIDSIFKAVDTAVLCGQPVQVEFSKNGTNAIAAYIGTIFGGGGVAPPTTNDGTGWADWMDGFKTAYAGTAPKIPIVFGYDGVHGFNPCPKGTILPHNIGLGATRDPYLVQKAERMAAIEITGSGANYTFAPCIATVRHVRWGRSYEGFGETPELTKVMAKAAILGLQSWDLSSPYSVLACAKHYAGDGGSANGDQPGITNTGPDSVLRKIHVEPYKTAVDAGVATVMASFGTWGPNNTAMHQNTELLTNVLKGQYGFDGFIQGDWGSGSSCYAPGIDMPMYVGANAQADMINFLANWIKAGGAQKARAIDAIRRVLRIKLRAGLFEKNPLTNRAITATIGSQLHRDVARECVRKSMVLLKNEGPVLPIAKGAKVHLVGEHAVNMGLQCGGWTVSWQGDPVRTQVEGTTIQQGFQKLSTGRITWSADATGIPADADVIVACVGERPCAEWDGTNNGQLSLDGTKYSYNGATDWWFCSIYNKNNYTQLIADCAATGKPVVCVLIIMRPLIITEEIKNTKAMVAAWLPGSEGGGIAEVLYGDYDFSGTLPHTWPATFGQEPINAGNMGDAVGAGGAPLFPYGFGLSYKGQLPVAGY